MQEVNPEVAEVLSVMDRMIGIPLLVIFIIGLILFNFGLIAERPQPGHPHTGEALVMFMVICVVYWLSRFLHWVL